MKKNYYFLASALPELQIGYPPDLPFNALQFLLKANLTEEDLQKTRIIRRYYDIQNIRAFWLKEDLDSRGNFDINELEEALLNLGFPEYVYDFLDKYEHLQERIRFFAALIEAYFYHETQAVEGFVKEYLTFEREWRLVLVGFRAKALQRDLTEELQFQDPSNELIAQLLAQKDSMSFEPPTRYADLKAIFEQLRDTPLELHQALCEYRYQKIEEMWGVDIFSIDRILAYMVQLIIVEKWLELDKKKGLQVIERIARK